MTTRPGGATADPPFIGREKELAAMRHALGLACTGQCRAVMLAGPPGIGKTRTAQHVARHEAASMLALWGRCPEEAGAPPYWPWLQMVRQYVALHAEADARAVLGAGAAHLAALDPELASLQPSTPPRPLPSDPAQARFHVFDAIAGFWQRAAARQPLLLIFDDLHCADESSLRLLEFVARECATSRMILLGTLRDAEVTRDHPLSGTLGVLARLAGAERLKLGGFSEHETARFMQAQGRALPPALSAALYRRTEGHPLFLAEMARLLDEADEGSGDEAQWQTRLQRVPDGVRDVIGSRLNRLSPMCSRVLSVAAIVGPQFDLGLLRALLDGIADDELLAAIDESCKASLVEPTGESSTWRISHALIRDALYDELPVPQRMRLHQQVAAALERRYADDPTPALSALAHHYQAAGHAATAGKALEYATRAARHAEATLAHEEAARLYAQALHAVEPGHEAQRCRLLLALGEAQTKAGRNEAALQSFGDAAALGRRLGLPDALASAALGYETCSWRCSGVGIVAAALVKEALAANPVLDSVLRARLLAALCRALVYADRIDAAVAIHGQAVRMARRLNEPATLFAALSAIVPSRWRPDLRALRLASGREAMQLAQRAGNPEWAVGHLTGWHVGDLMEAGDVEGAARTVEFGADTRAIYRQPYVRAVLMNCQAMLAQHAGRFDEAERIALQNLREAALADSASGAAGAAAVQLFTLRREQGRLAEVAPVLERFRQSVPDSVTWQPGYIVLCCELGRQEQARAAFERLALRNFDLGSPSDGARAGSLVYLAESCCRLGDRARAATLYELLKPHAGSGIVFGAHVADLGSADRVLGMLAGTMERWDEAEAHFERALAFDAGRGAYPWLAHTRHEYAAMLLERRRPGDEARAAALLDAALASSRELQMSALEQRVLALQRASHTAEGAGGPAGLTPREVEVLRMVAEGRTNQDIADALFRSVNTVANHVRHILAKIEATNRTEAAAFAARHGLLPPVAHAGVPGTAAPAPDAKPDDARPAGGG